MNCSRYLVVKASSRVCVSGEDEQRCPHCGTELTLPVDDPLGMGNYACDHCQGEFGVNWGEETVRWRRTD